MKPVAVRIRRYAGGECALLTLGYGGRRKPRHVLLDLGSKTLPVAIAKDVRQETADELDAWITERSSTRGVHARMVLLPADAPRLVKALFGVKLGVVDFTLPGQGLPFDVARGPAPSRFRWIMRQMDATRGQQVRAAGERTTLLLHVGSARVPFPMPLATVHAARSWHDETLRFPP